MAFESISRPLVSTVLVKKTLWSGSCQKVDATRTLLRLPRRCKRKAREIINFLTGAIE